MITLFDISFHRLGGEVRRMGRVVRRNFGDIRRKGEMVRGEEGDVRRQMYFAKQMSKLKSRKMVTVPGFRSLMDFDRIGCFLLECSHSAVPVRFYLGYPR